jgi:hypothetical protein
MSRTDNIIAICEKVAYKYGESAMGNLYHELLMAHVEKEIIEHTPYSDKIDADVEAIRLAYMKLYSDLTGKKFAPNA